MTRLEMGFVCFLTSSNSKVCPVQTLHDYLMRNSGGVDSVRPVFTPLNYPFSVLSSASVAGIMKKAIKCANVQDWKVVVLVQSFRPTGEIAAIENGVNPDTVQILGKWHRQECFYKHYAHAKPAAQATDCILLM